MNKIGINNIEICCQNKLENNTVLINELMKTLNNKIYIKKLIYDISSFLFVFFFTLVLGETGILGCSPLNLYVYPALKNTGIA